MLIKFFVYRSRNVKTKVIGCPKTIDGDLKCKEVPISFGFDTACKVSPLVSCSSRRKLQLRDLWC